MKTRIHFLPTLLFLFCLNESIWAKKSSDWSHGEYVTYSYEGTDGYIGGIKLTAYKSEIDETKKVLLVHINLKNRFGEERKGFAVYEIEPTSFHMVQYERLDKPGEDPAFKAWLQEFIGMLIVNTGIGGDNFGESDTSRRSKVKSCCGILDVKETYIETDFYEILATSRAYVSDIVPITGIVRRSSRSKGSYRNAVSEIPEKSDEIKLTSFGLLPFAKEGCNKYPTYIDFSNLHYENYDDYQIRIPYTWFVSEKVEFGQYIKEAHLGGCRHAGYFKMTELKGNPEELKASFERFLDKGKRGLLLAEPVKDYQTILFDEQSAVFQHKFQLPSSEGTYVTGMFFNGDKNKLIQIEIMNNFHPFADSLKDTIRQKEDPILVEIVTSFRYRSWWTRLTEYLKTLLFFRVKPTPVESGFSF